ncbi:MAG: phosphotriesterase-related protein [Chloroflexi bacterium]|nr:phosphotriesterase-related protein [Chloroflexota bacterium]
MASYRCLEILRYQKIIINIRELIMTEIQTILGPIDSNQLGVTLSHEHVLVDYSNDIYHYPWLFDMDQTKQKLIVELREAKAGGVDSIIDLSTPDLGRNIPFVKSVASEVEVNIVVATGIWRDVPRSFWSRTPDEIADIFTREIEVGISDTGVKAGVIKVANDMGGVTPEAELVLRGASRAAIRTGTPISTHHWALEEVGRQQIAVFQDENVPMNQICIGHSADTEDINYLEDLLKEGVYLSMDRYPATNSSSNPWQKRNITVKSLIDRGWADKLMLGHDYAPRAILAGDTYAKEEETRYLFLNSIGIPALITDGVSQKIIDTMQKDVPRRFLAVE